MKRRILMYRGALRGPMGESKSRGRDIVDAKPQLALMRRKRQCRDNHCCHDLIRPLTSRGRRQMESGEKDRILAQFGP